MHLVSKIFDEVTSYYFTPDYSVTDVVSTVYASDSSGLVASIENDGTTTTTQTIHTDHLGSTSVVTDEDGIMMELLDYHPYGTERISWSSSSTDGSAESQKTYIGEYSDDESGLSYLNARYYDPQRGQFLSLDTVYLSLGSGTDKREQVALLDPQLHNSYSYSRNNPVTLQDKEGEFIPLIIGAVWLAFEVGSTAYDVYTTADAWMDPNGSSWDRWSMIGGLAIGAVLPGGGYGTLAGKADDVIRGIRGFAGATSRTIGGAAQSFKSFNAFKNAFGDARQGYQWHHIVEQRNASIFGNEAVQNTQNLIEIPKELHQRISNYYSRIQDFSEGKTVREWLNGQSFQQQQDFGKQKLGDFGIDVK